jgi:putative peptidoglycan lipid II flippase
MSFLRSAGIVSICTLVSRILGMVRDVVMAFVFATGYVADAFYLAFMIPNLFRRIFGEGAFSAALVPTYTEYLQKEEPSVRRRFLGAVGTLLLLILLAVALLGILAAIITLFFLPQGEERWRLTMQLVIVIFPYLVFICLMAMFMAVLQTHKHFFTSAFAPVLLNVTWIAGALGAYWIFGKTAEEGGVSGDAQLRIVFFVAGAIVFGGLVQAAIHVPMLRRYNAVPKWNLDFNHHGVKRVRNLMAPMVLGLAVLQVNVFLDGVIARVLVPGDGAVSTLFYANRLVQFPQALIGVALGMAVLPLFAELVVGENRKRFRDTLEDALRVAAFLAIPATIGMMVLSGPIIKALFERGSFKADATARVSFTLLFYAPAIIPYCAYQVVSRAFYAMGDTKTPVKIGVYVAALNIVLNVVLVLTPLREAGIALATTVSAAIVFGVLAAKLRGSVSGPYLGSVLRSMLRVAGVSLAMGAASFGAWFGAQKILTDISGVKYLSLLAGVAAGVAVYVILVALLRFPEFGYFRKHLRRRHTP